MNYHLTLFEILISFLTILVVIIISRFFRPKKNKIFSKYYSYFIGYKILFAIVFALVYIYYFKGGDTFLYFDGSIFLLDQILKNPTNASNLLFGEVSSFSNLNYTGKEYLLNYFTGKDIILTSRLLVPFSFLCFKQYIATTILFTLVTSIGLWKLYTTLCGLYPSLYKHFAAGVLFYPTIAIWGSGILKDTITLMSIGLIFYCVYQFSIRKNIIRAFLVIALSTYLCLILKPYILYLFLPCMLLWLQNRISGNFKSPILRLGIGLLLTIAFSLAGFFVIQNISEAAGKYSLENVESIAKGFQSWHTYLAETRNQSGYSLGEFEFTFFGILPKLPAAFFVTFFRPFLFTDVDNLSLAVEGIQSFILLLLTIYVITRVGVLSFFKMILLNRDIRAFLLFALLFGITVGLTSYNFGALSRYKIPALPFFTASLSIIYYVGYLKPKGLAK